ncbi:MAG: bifunctional riboflavin kinase/FAD synthetase [Gemmataceae bacterium]|nr:bifunctional riboflavin kinase/FAD synthetase [Gemmata sp.]MDW8198455.1 bifunctional riboflavin kinase/FAD synthetase [Gemmataceae bacterium]
MALVYLEWHEYPPAEVAGGAVTIGNFDGVHRGHQALVAATRLQAEVLGGPAVVVTFSPPPHQVLHPSSERPPLTTLAQRAQLLHAAGADHVVVLRTSPALLALSAEAFFEDVITRQLAAKAVIEGYNFRFGRGRTGSNDTLRTLCRQAQIIFEEVPALTLAGEPVSSSRVRAALLRGDVRHAAELLGRHYRITGTVISGARRGRTLGFPTANLGDVPTVLPGLGVYAAWACAAGQTWPAAANIGPNPTFGDDARKIEVHLIGFSGDLYGQTLDVDFVSRLRDTRPFASADELVRQLQQDIEQAQGILTQE